LKKRNNFFKDPTLEGPGLDQDVTDLTSLPNYVLNLSNEKQDSWRQAYERLTKNADVSFRAMEVFMSYLGCKIFGPRRNQGTKRK
jgi:hypothetical protein